MESRKRARQRGRTHETGSRREGVFPVGTGEVVGGEVSVREGVEDLTEEV